MSVKLLAEHHLEFLSLLGGCTGLFESTLVKMSHCWKSYVTAHLYFLESDVMKALITVIRCIGPVKRKNLAQNCDYFLTHWFKHFFLVRKRTVSSRRFF